MICGDVAVHQCRWGLDVVQAGDDCAQLGGDVRAELGADLHLSDRCPGNPPGHEVWPGRGLVEEPA